jgi:ABC-2 type transport system permease protein
MSGAYCAIGVMSSSFLRSQIGAALVAFAIGFFFYLVGYTTPFQPTWMQPIAAAIGIGTRFTNIARGVIDLRDFVYYVSLISACLIIAHTTLESRRWR